MVDTNIKLNTAGKSFDDMSDSELISYLDNRYADMSSAEIRTKQEVFRDEADDQFTALSVYDSYGNLKVNIPLEQNLIDTYEGRASGKIEFDVQPDGKQANVDELQPAEYALEFYLEGGENNGTGFYDEAPILRRSKARYGTVFSLISLENITELKYKIKEDAEINDIGDLENQDNYEPYILDMWELFPKYLNIRSVFIDEKALGQTQLQKAEDIIIEKTMSIDKINFMRGDKDGYDVEGLEEDTQTDDSKSNKDLYAKNQTTVRFYFNKLTKEYILYSPGSKKKIHHSKMLYNHGQFPIESCQHYTDENNLYGIGLPRKIKYLKGYKSEILQSLLDNAAMSSGLNFIVGNEGEVEDWNLGGNGVNVWRTTTGAEQVKPVQPQINSGLIGILNVLDDLVVQDTGENVRASVDAQSDKVGIVEIMEENKAVRHKSVDENWNLYLDRALTIMLNNIAQFVPALFSKTTKEKVGDKEVTKIEYPYVRVPNTEIKKKGKNMEFIKEDNYGKYGYFELKMDTLPKGLGVKVVTASSHNSLPLIRKANFDKWIANKLKLMDLAAADPSGKSMKQLFDSINVSEANQWMNDVYGFEDKLKSATGKDKIKAKNLEMVEQLRAKMETLNSIPQDGQIPGNAGPVSQPQVPSINESEGLPNPVTGEEDTEITEQLS